MMILQWCFRLSVLFPACLAQSTSIGSNAGAVTVTSTLAIVILPSSNSSSIAPSVSSATSDTTSSSTLIVLPTNPYTGQAILTGTCNIPQYTGLALQNGAVVEVPLVGCSDDRPECCPSLSPPESAASATSATSQITSTPTTTGLTATGVISMLSASPLSICPSDFVDIDPVCCPSGYSLYGQAIVGNIPCYSMLSTVVPIPSAVSNSISSVVAQTASATATVSVIINQVFALGLPCADDSGDGLSTGAKAGIGVGAGVGGLLLIGLILFILVRVGRKRLQKRQEPAPFNTAHYQPQEKRMTASTGTMSPPAGMGSPYMGPPSPQFRPQDHSYGFARSSAFEPQQSHASWGIQTPVAMPPRYRSPIEMQAPTAHEIDNSGRTINAGNQDLISSETSNPHTSEISAYESQQERAG